MDALVILRCIRLETKNYGWDGPHSGPLEVLFEIAHNPEPILDENGHPTFDPDGNLIATIGEHMTPSIPYGTARILFAEPQAHDLFEEGAFYTFRIGKVKP